MNTRAHLDHIRTLAGRLARPIKLMEVCGTHTMAAFRSGLRSLLPENVSLLSGPGCPVCVTPNTFVDRAVEIARQPDTLVTTFGDMVRVPGSRSSLERARAEGARVQIVYSPLDALNEARRNPGQRTVFLGVGFETTVPTVAWTLKDAAASGITNYSVLCAHKTMPHAMAGLLQGGEVKVDGFLCPGHVSVVIGARAYTFICRDYGLPCVVAGFEPEDMILSIEMLLAQLDEGRAEVEIEYTRSVNETGNPAAQAVIAEVFEECDVEWRGLGTIPRSGLRIRDALAAHDAEKVFTGLGLPEPAGSRGCICGEVLRGAKTPLDCRLFRKVCKPTSPVGACMVSSEGTCAAYFKYARRQTPEEEGR